METIDYVIKKNSNVPISSEKKTYFPLEPGQRSVFVEVYQGYSTDPHAMYLYIKIYIYIIHNFTIIILLFIIFL